MWRLGKEAVKLNGTSDFILPTYQGLEYSHWCSLWTLWLVWPLMPWATKQNRVLLVAVFSHSDCTWDTEEKRVIGAFENIFFPFSELIFLLSLKEKKNQHFSLSKTPNNQNDVEGSPHGYLGMTDWVCPIFIFLSLFSATFPQSSSPRFRGRTKSCLVSLRLCFFLPQINSPSAPP